MSIIVGLEDGKGKVWLGGDRCACNGTLYSMATAKVFKKKISMIPEVWMGFGIVGTARFQQILEYDIKIPDISKAQNTLEYLSTIFVHNLKGRLKVCGYLSVDKTVEKQNTDDSPHVSMLIALEGKLYSMSSDFDIFKWDWAYDAIGSGQDYALGSFDTTELFTIEKGGKGMEVKERVHCALSAAANLSSTCAAPFDYICV